MVERHADVEQGSYRGRGTASAFYLVPLTMAAVVFVVSESAQQGPTAAPPSASPVHVTLMR
jgi:hypothetical protein